MSNQLPNKPITATEEIENLKARIIHMGIKIENQTESLDRFQAGLREMDATLREVAEILENCRSNE